MLSAETDSNPRLDRTPRRVINRAVPIFSTVERLLLPVNLGSAKAKLLGKVKPEKESDDEKDG